MAKKDNHKTELRVRSAEARRPKQVREINAVNKINLPQTRKRQTKEEKEREKINTYRDVSKRNN